MNLLSGAKTEKKTLSTSKKRLNKQLAAPLPHMAEMGEIKHLMVEMKESFSKKDQGFQDGLQRISI